jgi:mono/diheme cytochrome c family protein
MMLFFNKILRLIFFISLFFFIAMSFRTLQDDWVVPDQFKNMKNPYIDVEDEDEIGADLYKVHCRSCHGKTGLGDGSKAFELESDVKDFSSNVFKSQTDGSIYFKIIMGRNEMPSFDKKIRTEEDRWLLVNYVRSF